MEINLEFFKNEEAVKYLLTYFEMKEEYYKFHDFVKKSGVNFEIQLHHDLLILPLKNSENELFTELLLTYYKINPLILDVYNSFIAIGLDRIYANNARIDSSNLFDHQKVGALTLISKSISNVIIQLGENESKLPVIEKLLVNLEAQASKYKAPKDKLIPKYESFFYEKMLNELAKKRFISSEFLDPKNRFEWVNFAFYFGGKTHNINSSLLTLNWMSSSSKLAEFLMFLFFNLIDYKFKNKKEFINWIVLHISIKGEPIKKDSKRFQTLNRSIKRIKDNSFVYFKVNESNLFEIGYFVTHFKNP